MPLDYDKIPEELRWNRNWLLAGPDEKGSYKAPYSFNSKAIFHVKPTETTNCKDIETIIEASVLHKPCGIGFLLSDTDIYTCIDLDVKNINNEPDHAKWTSQEVINRHWKIIEKFDSYTERSASGQGFHIWVRGDIGSGCRRDGVEVYSRERFIVCTGDVFIDKDIEDRQELLNILVAEIRSAAAPKIELIDLEETESDHVIFERARNADNSDKFIALCNGDWSGYPSQSEADLALLSIFTFYSKSNSQVRRLFRQTKLADRPKARKNDSYLNRTLKLIRSREANEEIIDAASVAAGKQLLATLLANKHSPVTHPLAPFPQAQTGILAGTNDSEDEFEYAEGIGSNFSSALDIETPPTNEIGLQWPPGMAGALAYYIYQGSPRPVKEVSIVAALGLMAGISGKAFCIPQSGLNIYLVLVAKSAIGKEAMHSGIANVLGFLRDAVPNGMSFVDFTDYASGPALAKAVASNPCFVNVSGEWGRKLRRLGQEDGRDGPMQQLRTVMTNLYQKSGPKSVVGGIGYSDKEKNIASVSGVSYSMIGETTPSTFYDSLTETMMEDGFLSRFTIVEYTGNRPEDNTHVVKEPSWMLKESLCSLTTRSIDLNARFQTQEVLKGPEATRLLGDFNKECDLHINSSDDEGFRQMWNRAHLKAYRIAALLAVGDNHTFPVIDQEQATWAIDLIRRDIAVMSRRINSGDVGVGDAPREKKILSLIEKFLREPTPASYGVPVKMREASVVPRKYLQICTQKSGAFTSHRNGQNAALDASLKSLMDSGYLSEMPKEKALLEFGFQGKCFRVINIPKSKT
jgi:hypothetical protein